MRLTGVHWIGCIRHMVYVASKFLFAFQTRRELRGEAKGLPRFSETELVAALGKKPVEFNHKLADLRTNGASGGGKSAYFAPGN
ncbi:MAG: hypothetical protein ACLSE8_04335 [Parasutterella sp.]